MADDRSYSDEQIRAILDRALRGSLVREGVNHSELLAVAAEIGLSSADVERAARELQEDREIDDAKRRILSRRRRIFAAHLGAYLLVNGFAFAVNALTTPGQWWVLFPVFIWGFALIVHALFAFSSAVSERSIARERRADAKRQRVAAAPAQQRARVRLEPNQEVSDEMEGEAEGAPTTARRAES